MLSKERLNKLIRLNAEFATATPSRQQEIQNEIVSMIPKELYQGGPTVVNLSTLQSELKVKLEKLVEASSRSDFEEFSKEVSSLHDKIQAHAEQLGVNLPKTDLDKALKELLEQRFGKQ